jgi:hypothetical protein
MSGGSYTSGNGHGWHDAICSNELLPQLYITLSVENFSVGSFPVKSFPVKTLSTRDQNGKLYTG